MSHTPTKGKKKSAAKGLGLFIHSPGALGSGRIHVGGDVDIGGGSGREGSEAGNTDSCDRIYVDEEGDGESANTSG